MAAPAFTRGVVRLATLLVLLGVALAGSLAGAGVLASANGVPGAPASRAAPARLSDTGLYADIATKRVRADNLPYAPQYSLWSDGMTKRRWIHLPPGAYIDGSNPDAWRFPVGTKLWKEFSARGHRVETRLIERLPDGTWRFAAYAWDAGEHDAALAPERGIPDAYPLRDDVAHDIPGVADCQACHEGRSPPVLGFTRIQLSQDRDPLAPHAEPVEADFLDLPRLVRQRLLRGGPPSDLAAPPRIPARSPVARAALGYLQANCGICHNGTGPLASKGLALDYVSGATREEDLPAHRTAVGQPSRFGSTRDRTLLRIAPGDPDASVVTMRMAALDATSRMPPLGTKIVDEEALALIRRWIREDVEAGGTTASAREEGRR